MPVPRFSIFYSGLPRNMKIRDIIDYFSDFGEVYYIRPDKRRAKLGFFCYSYLHRGSGLVQFSRLEDKEKVLSLKNHCIEGKYFDIK